MSNQEHYKFDDIKGHLMLRDTLKGQSKYTKMIIRDVIAQKYFEKNEFPKQRRQYLKALQVFPKSISIRYKLALALEPFTNRKDLICSLLERAILLGKNSQNNKSQEMEYYKKSLEKLALIYCQENRNQEAFYLLRLLGCTHRLSTHVLYYQPSPLVQGNQFVKCFDNVFTLSSLTKLQHCFDPSALFWKTHKYNEYHSNGYFSYTFLLENPQNYIEQTILQVYQLLCREFPEKAKRIKVAEWWAHCRPHSMGHQMHYDSENEGKGTIRHPILSCVVYLSECGGPTLVTNQLMGGDLASKGYLVYPKVNRLAVFDSSYLHGVVPGKGKKRVRDRRVTFMIGFWDSITVYDEGSVARASPGQPEWCEGPLEMDLGEYSNTKVNTVKSVWQLIDGTELTDFKLPMYEKCFQGF